MSHNPVCYGPGVPNLDVAPVPFVALRNPATSDIDFPYGKIWVNRSNDTAWILTSKAAGVATWTAFGSGAVGGIVTITGDSGGAESPLAGNFSLLGTANQITVTGGANKETFSLSATLVAPGSITSTTTIASGTTITAGTGIINNGSSVKHVTNVNSAASPYTVLATDVFLAVNSTAGTVTLNFPNTPTAGREIIIADVSGMANVNNITVTTPGGTTTFVSGGVSGTSVTVSNAYDSIYFIANTTSNYIEIV